MLTLWDTLTTIKIDNEMVQILTALLIGLLIGAEREYRNKSAGLRTFILISFGACLFTILSIKIGSSNPDRIAANIITGIGFLGAGAIFKDDNKVGGITTASTIWATASLGMCVGAGHVLLALSGLGLVWFVLSVLVYLQDFIDKFNKIIDYKLTLASPLDIAYCEALFKQCGLKMAVLRELGGGQQWVMTWRLTGRYHQHLLLVERLRQDLKIIAYQY